MDLNSQPNWIENLPDGYRFLPTIFETFKYLRRKVCGGKIWDGVIPECDVYLCEPSLLSGQNDYDHAYYFTPRDRNGKRTIRSTKDGKGYWRITSKINEFKSIDKSKIGRRNTLVYFLKDKGDKGKGQKTNWIMREYVLDDNLYPSTEQANSNPVNDVVLCRIYERKQEDEEKRILPSLLEVASQPEYDYNLKRKCSTIQELNKVLDSDYIHPSDAASGGRSISDLLKVSQSKAVRPLKVGKAQSSGILLFGMKIDP